MQNYNSKHTLNISRQSSSLLPSKIHFHVSGSDVPQYNCHITFVRVRERLISKFLEVVALFVKGMEWNGTVPETRLIPKKFFLKLIPTFLLFALNQSLFITFQIIKLLQNKIFYFFLYKTLLLFFLINYICYSYSTISFLILFNSQTEPMCHNMIATSLL